LINQFTGLIVNANADMIEGADTTQQLQAFIDSGAYEPGDRLPAERELINSLGISRTSLRKGLDALERKGVIWRHVGKGTFVSGRENPELVPGIAKLSQEISPVQMMRARFSLEPAIAREAAANASGEAVDKLRASYERTLQATSWDEYEHSDDVFHRTIAEATGNALLVSLFDHLNQVRRAVAWHQVIRKTDSPGKKHQSFFEHEVLLNAIEARDSVAAHKAMREHLISVSNRLFGDFIP